MSQLSNRPRNRGPLAKLQRQFRDNFHRIAHFEALDATLKSQRRDPRVADRIRLNREMINAFRRSAQLLEHRLQRAGVAASPSWGPAPF